MSAFAEVTCLATKGPLRENGTYEAALLFVGPNAAHPFVHVNDYDPITESWWQGTYYRNPVEPYFRLRGWDPPVLPEEDE